MSTLHHKLPSGRVLLLDEPFNAEELEALQTPEGIALMEEIADGIQRRATKELGPDDREYGELLAQHGVPTEA